MRLGRVKNVLKSNSKRLKRLISAICFSLEYIYVTVRSEGFEDRKNGRVLAGRARAYIKVNGREKSPQRRGLNVVVLNRKGKLNLHILVKNGADVFAYFFFSKYRLNIKIMRFPEFVYF